MEKCINVTLDQLSSLLIQQFEPLPSAENCFRITRNYHVKVDNEIITVEVRMDKLKVSMPKTEIVCPDPLKFTASVEMKPLNGKVWAAVVTHFKNQTRPDFHNRERNKATFDSFNVKYDENTVPYYMG